MTKEKDVLQKYNIIPKKISYKNKLKIITTSTNVYCLKVKENQITDVYEYLRNHNFNNYIQLISDSSDPYEIYPYISEKNIDKESKALELIYTLSLLHTKTTTYKEINLEQIKEKYEKISNEINKLLLYYYDLQDYIETNEYMSPAEYYLIRNMNKLYISLNNAKHDIDKWYKLKEKETQERQVLLHNKISLEHFIKSENNYLINWNKSCKGNVVYDFLNFFKNDYKLLEMENLFELYQTKYPYTEDEKYLFKALLQIPWKITFKETNYVNTLKVKELLDYLEKANHLILKNDEKNQKA